LASTLWISSGFDRLCFVRGPEGIIVGLAEQLC
jgi:hypothetical protein